MGNAYARWLVAGTIAVALAVLAVHRHYAHPYALRAGDRLTPLAVTSMQGAPAILHPAGRAQIINVFATWCPPCRAEMPAFAQFAEKASRQGIDIVGIDQEENAQAVSAFAHTFDLRFPLYIDETNVTHDVLGARMIPTTIFIDAAGVIRWRHSGPLGPAEFHELHDAVASAG